MATFLIRDYSDPKGYVEYRTDSVWGVLPRTRGESYVPWAITPDLRVVYAKYGEHRSWPNRGGLTRYDMLTSQTRRRLCESEYGNFALNERRYTNPAVKKVTEGVHHYMVTKYAENRQRALDVFCGEKTGIAHYMYSDSYSFGRVGGSGDRPQDKQAVWDKALSTLLGGSLQEVLALHDGIGRKILPALGGPELITYKALEATVRPDSMFGKDVRGRISNPIEAMPTQLAGIAAVGTGGGLKQVDQIRKRGVDMFVRDPNAGGDYYSDLDTRNLLFGAGPSGTTGTLLQAAFTFGKLGKGSELTRQYVMAIVGYLIGGGMHSLHETMVVASRVGVPYEPGAFIKSLPESFSRSLDFRKWNCEYYDIVTLGGTHWMYNKNDGAAAQTAALHGF